MAQGQYDLNDFRNQIVRMQAMGPVDDLIRMIPGNADLPVELNRLDAEEEIQQIQGIIDSMTPAERRRTDLIDLSRSRRNAAGAGVDRSDVSGLVKQFNALASIVQSMERNTWFDSMRTMHRLTHAA